MLAWRIHAHGGREALKLESVPDPTPGPGEARIRVQAVGINHLDVWVRKGVPGHHFPLPITPGSDVAGLIESLGPGTEAVLARDGLRIGSEILVNPGLSCGRCRACLGGLDPLCPHYEILGENRDGGCAELVCVPIQNLIARPSSLSPTLGAALAIPFLTAWTMLTRKARLEPGESVLIQAGGSGVSIAAIQIAKLLGAEVITTVGSDAKIAPAHDLGADHVIQYRKTPFREELKKLLRARGKKGCEVVVDHVGADTFKDSVKSLAWGGRLVTCGATSGADIQLDLKQVFFKNLSILGSTMGSKADFIQIVSLVNQGMLKPVVDTVYPMDELATIMERLEKREVFGKLVLKVI